MNIKNFNNRIIIEKRTITKVNGIRKEVYTDFHKCWCSINSLYGNELYKALEIQQQDILNFTIRYSKNLEELNTKDFRIKWKNRIYNIVAIDFYNFNKEKITIKAQEVQ